MKATSFTPSTSFLTTVRLLVERGVVDESELPALAEAVSPPWWLAILQTLAAWLASLFVLGSFFIPLAVIGDSAPARAIGGIALGAGALWLFQRDKLFTNQMALAFSLAAQALLMSAVLEGIVDFERDYRIASAFGAAAAAAMMLGRSSDTHLAVCGALVLGFLGAAIGPGQVLVVYAAAVCALAVALWLTRERWCAHPAARRIKGLANASALAALASAWLLPLATGPDVWLHVIEGNPAVFRPLTFSVVAGVTLIATVIHVSRGATLVERGVAVCGAAALALASHQSPGLAVCAALFLAAFQAGHRGWTVLALLGTLGYLGLFYYSLSTTLLMKSMLLAGSGVLLLALRAALLREGRTT